MSSGQAEIKDDDALLRRVANKPNMFKHEGAVVRPSSAAFKPAGQDGGISVDVRRLLPDPSDPLSPLEGLPEHGLVELRATVPRANGHDVVHAPLKDNDAHANIFPAAGLGKADQRRAQREMALASVWIRQPSGAMNISA